MRERSCELNPAALMVEAVDGIVAPEVISSNSISRVNIRLAKLERIKKDCCEMLAEHDSGARSACIRFYEPFDWVVLGLWMGMLLHIHGGEVMRIKGMVDVGAHGSIVINGVQHIIHPSCHLDSRSDEEWDSQIVLITKGLKLEQILRSLVVFQNIFGSVPEISETSLGPYSKG